MVDRDNNKKDAKATEARESLIGSSYTFDDAGKTSPTKGSEIEADENDD